MELIDAILQENEEAALALLGELHFENPPAAYENLRRILRGLTPPQFGTMLDLMLGDIAENPDPDRALNNLERFGEQSSGATALASLAADRPFLFQLLFQTLGYSQFMADVLIRYPHYAAWLGEPDTLLEKISLPQFVKELGATLDPLPDAEARQHAAVRWQRRHLLRSSINVMRGEVTEEAFMHELSEIAIALIRRSLQEAEIELRPKFGRPMEEDAAGGLTDVEAVMGIIAMGKLGGMELNFSSDIDLIFVYSAEGRTTGPENDERGVRLGQISNHDYFSRLARSALHFLSSVSAEGYLYRVDTRLRPDGDEGPLARALAAFEIYHETQGRPWERMALIKALAVAGPDSICRQFEEMSQGLVYGSGMGPDVVSQVRDLKDRIDSQVDQGDRAGREIKRGRGGIREIEFYVQTLQLLHGPAEPHLRSRSSMEAIAALVERGHLDAQEAEQMGEDYLYLRRLEHRLQMLDLRQTHTIPQEKGEVARLAHRCGIRNAPDRSAGEILWDDWQSISARVHGRFSKFFELANAEINAGSEEEQGLERLGRMILAGSPDKDLIPELADYGLESANSIASLRRLAGRGKSIYLSPRASELFTQILPALLESARDSARPAIALAHLDSVLAASGAYATYYEMFQSNPKLLALLLKAFGAANSWAQTLISHPEYLDYLLDPSFLASQPDPEGLLRELSKQIAKDVAKSGNSPAAAVARFGKLRALLTGFARLENLISPGEVPARLSAVADASTEAVLRCVCAQKDIAPAKMETATADSTENDAGIVRGFCVLAMGKYGAAELSYFSDLDIIFCWDDRPGDSEAWTDPVASAVASEVISILSEASPEGVPFSIDARLRPEGSSAPLAPPFSRYLDYYASRAELWELQSLMKIRAVAGDPALGKELIDELCKVAQERLKDLAKESGSLEEALAPKVVAMRDRIEQSVKPPKWVLCDFKKGPGGVVDLEFLGQYFQLLQLGAGTDWIGLPADQIFAMMSDSGQLEASLADSMRADYAFLRQLETRSRLLFETESSRAPARGEKLESFRRIAQDLLPPGEDDISVYLMVLLGRNRKRFGRFLKAE